MEVRNKQQLYCGPALMLKTNLVIIAFIFLSMIQPICVAEKFAPRSSFDICFTPGEKCQEKIIQVIRDAKKEILVQAYSFSDLSIASALILAQVRGVNVKILLDKSQLNSKSSLIPYFIANKIYLKIDNEPIIAHNKIIIADRAIVVGGSYNFTYAAKNKNAENVTLIYDPKFAEKFVKYWYTRDAKSKAIGSLPAARNGES
jgi:phosphatidylserine/phosphatidylglycerophosphate/cardiolipin synthase-like enzyme